MSWFRRFLAKLSESDEDRLAEELRVWAAHEAGTVRPVEGFEALEVVLTDGTGMLSARWLGRRGIPGLALGSRLVVEGVLGVEAGVKKIVNPTFEFASEH